MLHPERRVYNVHEVSKILGIGINQAYDFIKSNPPFPVKTIRSRYLIPKIPFDQWLQESST